MLLGAADTTPMGGRTKRGLCLVALAVSVTGFTLVASTTGAPGAAPDDSAAPFAGFTQMATTPSYVLMVNVLPAEEMFTAARNQREHPTVGELVIRGRPGPIRRWSRHVEAHIYSKTTGEVVTDVDPVIEVINRTTGKVIPIDATLMQDVVIGAIDRHFGTNAVVPPKHDFTVVVSIGDEEASFDGRLL